MKLLLLWPLFRSETRDSIVQLFSLQFQSRKTFNPATDDSLRRPSPSRLHEVIENVLFREFLLHREWFWCWCCCRCYSRISSRATRGSSRRAAVDFNYCTPDCNSARACEKKCREKGKVLKFMFTIIVNCCYCCCCEGASSLARNGIMNSKDLSLIMQGRRNRTNQPKQCHVVVSEVLFLSGKKKNTKGK